MAETEDKEGKTEDPTEHRLKTALEKGNIPVSREVSALGPLLGVCAVLLLIGDEPILRLVQYLARIFDNAGAIELVGQGDVAALMWQTAAEAAFVVGPIVAVLALSGLLPSFLQNQPQLLGERIRPQGSRISPSAGLKRIFGARGLGEFAKSMAKLVLVSAVAYSYARSAKDGLQPLLHTDVSALPHRLLALTASLVGIFAAAGLVLSGIDIVWVRFQWKRDLRMSRQELKDEMKQMEGDPLIKGRIRSIARDRARKRMIAAVPRATLVIANPTHFAVALRYVRSEGGAPLVLAKGKDLIALRIREVAEQQGIPVVEDKPLARSLHDSVEVDRMIPPEFYKAVAKIILFLSSRGRLKNAW